MKFKINKNKDNTCIINVEVDWDEFKPFIDEEFNRKKGSFKIKGFRKGKISKEIIENMYGKGIFYEGAANSCINKKYIEIIDKEKNLLVVSSPKIDVVQIEENKPFIFNAIVALKPDIKLGDYIGLTFKKDIINVTDDDIKIEMEKIKSRYTKRIDIKDRKVMEEDVVNVNFKGYLDNKFLKEVSNDNASFKVGSGVYLPDFEKSCIGLKINEKKEVAINLPKDYKVEKLQSKSVLFKIIVTKITNFEIPEINDDFIKNTLKIKDVNTVDELKDFIKNKILKDKEYDFNIKKENELIKKVVDNSKTDIPEQMINSKIDEMIFYFNKQLQYQKLTLDNYLKYTNSTMEKLRESLKDKAKDEIKFNLIIEKIIEVENISVDDKELNKELENISNIYNINIDSIDKNLVKNNLKRKKVIQLIVDKSVESK